MFYKLRKHPYKGGDLAMDTPTRQRSGLANNFWLQMAALVIVVAIIIALAAKYIW
jgi:hypothetical protein